MLSGSQWSGKRPHLLSGRETWPTRQNDGCHSNGVWLLACMSDPSYLLWWGIQKERGRGGEGRGEWGFMIDYVSTLVPSAGTSWAGLPNLWFTRVVIWLVSNTWGYCVYVYMCVYIHVCMCVCAYMCVCVHVYVCTCAYVYIHACMCICVYMCICVHVCICVCVYICICVHVCICVCVYMCVCVYVCTCVYMYICIYVYACMCACLYVYGASVLCVQGTICCCYHTSSWQTK